MRQYDRVKIILQEATAPISLYAISRAIYQRWGVMYSDAAISARVRDIRHDLEMREGKTITCRKIPKQSTYLYQIVDNDTKQGAA